MTTDLDRRRLAAAAELERFEADERRRLAYADRAGTLEPQAERVSCGDPECCPPLQSHRQLADGTGSHSRKEMEVAVAFTGLRCDAGVQCTAQIAGDTSSRDALKRLHLKAERYNWQVLWVDGHSAHWCERHRDVDRESVRRLK